MKSLRKKFRGRYFRRGIIYFLSWCLVVNTTLPAVLAGPIGGTFVAGPTGTITTVGNATNVVVDGPQSVIEWNSLDTLGGLPADRESLNFFDGGYTNAAVLNRVMSGYGTQFFGDLNADAGMRIFIVNPAGIVFGEGSIVNVTQLIASNLNITNDNFLSGNYEFAGDIDGVDVYERLGVINNSDDLYGSEGVALIGRKILNTGVIETGEGGFVVLAAGDKVYLGHPGSQILTEMSMYSVTNPEEGEGEIINDGEIMAPAGSVVLAAGDLFASAVELPKVSSGVGRIEQNGHIHADGATGDGGNVSLTAADEVIIASGSETTANAVADGDAGLVVVHSTGLTDIEADSLIQTTGGHWPEPGLGGFDDSVDTTVEITGDYVNLAGDIDASALTEGKRGKIVVDALDITVADGPIPNEPLDNTIYEEWIEDQTKLFDPLTDLYRSTDVELVAHSKDAGNITVEYMDDGILGTVESGNGGSGDIVLRTKYDTGAITFLEDGSGNRTAIYSTAGGNVYMLAGGDDPDTGDITEGSIIVGDIISTVPQSIPAGWPVEPGKIRLLAVNGGSITTGELKVEGGSYDEISAIASGDLTINGDITTYAHQVDEGLEVGQARTCLVSEHGDVEINGEIKVEAHAKDVTNADIHIDAGQDIRIDLQGGQILASAFTSAEGIANASVKIHAGTDTDPLDPSDRGEITIINPKSADKAIVMLAQAGGKKSEISSSGQNPEYEYQTNGGTTAELDIDDKRTDDCPDCPKPPGLIPPLNPWAFTTHMSTPIEDKNVFADDDIGFLEVVPDESWEVLEDGVWRVETDHGTLVITREGNYGYEPEEGFVGLDRFTYKAKVIETGVETDLIEVTITISNELPVANSGSASSHMRDQIVEPFNTNDIDDIINEEPFTDDIIVDVVEQPLHGIVTVQKDGDVWTYTYTPTPDENGDYFVGTETFTYSVTDGQLDGEGNPIVVLGTVEITRTNNLPVQSNDTVSVGQNESVVINVLDNDFDPDFPTDQLTVIQDSITVQHGQLILNPDNTFTYIPDPGYVGQDTFTYAVKDGQENQPLVWTTVTIWVDNALYIPAAPLVEPISIEVSGCPALIKWVAAELGTDEKKVQIWVAKALASPGNIQPCDACEGLKEAATILQDADGTRVAALASVINEFASTDAPPTEEQMASIANAIANDIEGNIQYAAAGEYLDALAKYVGILSSELGFTADEAVQFATNNYVDNLVETENVGVAAYVAARLAVLAGSE